MSKLELRVVSTALTVNDEDLCVEGLVNKTESWSHTLGQRKKFKEKIAKGAFTRAIKNAQRIDFLSEHDNTKLLSTTENESLELWEDEEGLQMRAIICPTSYGRDLHELMKSKLVRNMSFGFKVVSDKWSKLANGTYERVVNELELLEVSAVRNPAYPQSAIAARGIDFDEEVEIPDDVEEIREREEENMDNDTKSSEQRAYASYLYGRTDVINSAMTIVAESSSLSGYLMKYVGEDKDTASVLVSLQHAITMANKIINDEIQVLVDDFNKYDSEIKAINSEVEVETNSIQTEKELSEERAEDVVETVEVAEKEVEPEVEPEVEETKEDTKVEHTETEKPVEENRTRDVASLRATIKERR